VADRGVEAFREIAGDLVRVRPLFHVYRIPYS